MTKPYLPIMLIFKRIRLLKNKDWKQVRSTIYSSILPLEIMEKGEDAIKAYIESNYQGVSKFLNRLEAVAE